MTGRIPFGLLTLLTALVCSPIQAQNPMGPPPGYGVQPAGFQQFQPFQEHEGLGEYHGAPYSFQRAPVGGPPGPTPRTVFEELPDDSGFVYEDTPLGKILTETIRRSWFRGEYMLWRASGPGGKLLGQQPLNGVPHVQLLGEPINQQVSQGVMFSRSVNGATGISNAPTLDEISINSLNGFRGTFGIPLPAGQIEISSFVFSKNAGSINASDFIQTAVTPNPAVLIGGNVGADGNPAVNGRTAQFYTQPVFVNGVPSNLTATSPAIDYDVSYRATLSTSTWGSEVNYVSETSDPNSIFQLHPSYGLRYFNYRDKLLQFGQYNVPNALNPLTNDVIGRTINSSANNNLFGPQLGLRAELVHSRFAIGVEPKIMFAINTWQSSLDTSKVFGTTDRAQNLTSNGATFSPLFDAKFYGNIALSKNVSTYISYNFLYAGQLNRSFNDIIYNQNAAGQSDFQLKRQFSESILQGMSFGFDFRY